LPRETKNASPLEEIVVATAFYSRETAPRLGVLFNAIGAFSAAAKDRPSAASCAISTG